MLPSTAPYQVATGENNNIGTNEPFRLRGGARTGTHATTRTADVQAARAYQVVRVTRSQRNRFWRGNVT